MSKESYEKPVMVFILLSGTNVVLTSCGTNFCPLEGQPCVEGFCEGYGGCSDANCEGYGGCPAYCQDTGDTCENFPCEGTDNGGGGECAAYGFDGMCNGYGDFGCTTYAPCSPNEPGGCGDTDGEDCITFGFPGMCDGFEAPGACNLNVAETTGEQTTEQTTEAMFGGRHG